MTTTEAPSPQSQIEDDPVWTNTLSLFALAKLLGTGILGEDTTPDPENEQLDAPR